MHAGRNVGCNMLVCYHTCLSASIHACLLVYMQGHMHRSWTSKTSMHHLSVVHNLYSLSTWSSVNCKLLNQEEIHEQRSSV